MVRHRKQESPDKMQVVLVRLTVESHEGLKAAANQWGYSLNWFAAEAVEHLVKEVVHAVLAGTEQYAKDVFDFDCPSRPPRAMTIRLTKETHQAAKDAAWRMRVSLQKFCLAAFARHMERISEHGSQAGTEGTECDRVATGGLPRAPDQAA